MLGLVKRGGQEGGIGQRGRCRWIQYDHVGDNDGEHVDHPGQLPSWAVNLPTSELTEEVSGSVKTFFIRIWEF